VTSCFIVVMAEKQDHKDATEAAVTATGAGSTDAEHDEELDTLLNSKDNVSSNLYHSSSRIWSVHSVSLAYILKINFVNVRDPDLL